LLKTIRYKKMKLVLLVLTFYMISSCSGEKDVKNAENQGNNEMSKEVADLKNELKLLREETRKQKLEIETQLKTEIETQAMKQKTELEQLRQQMKRQKMQSEEEIAKENVEIDHQKLAMDLQKVAMFKQKTEIDEQKVKLVQSATQNSVKQQGKRQADLFDETRKICRSEIQKFYSDHSTCATGIVVIMNSKGDSTYSRTVQFGRVFPRPPTVMTAIYGFDGSGYINGYTRISTATKTSAVIKNIERGDGFNWIKISWMACL